MIRKNLLLANRIIQRPRVRRTLGRIARSVTSDPSLHQDLSQEAALHLWRQLQRCPGHKWSWYLQACRFHLQDNLRQGSSIDSLKNRRRLRGSVGENDSECIDTSDPRAETTLLSSVCARDTINELSRRLDPSARAVLPYLALGHGVREIARALGVSHPAIIKRCLKIATVAAQIGISLIV